MRKINFFFILYIVVFLCVACSPVEQTSTDLQKAQIYFVDNQMLRLIPVDCYYNHNTADGAAKLVLRELIRGRDDNPKIKRLIPNIENGMTVRVEGQVAYVDITQEMADAMPDNRNWEVLMVYQVVDSLTSIEGIVNVRFTIAGKTERKLKEKGSIDMRETFIPDYMVEG